MTSTAFVNTMNSGLDEAAFGASRYSPALLWQTKLIGLATPDKGNVDLDPFGYVDESDVELLRDYLANKTTLSGAQLSQADVNKDGKVDSTDLSLLEKYASGQITSFTSNT